MTTTMTKPEEQALAMPPKDSQRAGRTMTLRHLFDQQRPELAHLLPRGMSLDRLYRMALSECVKNPKLLQCSAESWALAMQTCGSQGLYPDSGVGLMYLIPREVYRKDLGRKVWEVSAQRGYQGDIALARNSGEIADIYAEVVYQNDTYKVTLGLHRDITHERCEDEPGPLRACYAVAKLTNGEIAFVTLTKADVMRHKASSQSAGSDSSPWTKHEAAMWKKTAIHELFKWIPKSSEKLDKVSRAILEDAPPRGTEIMDGTALLLGSSELPSAPVTDRQPASLDGLADRLEGEEPQEDRIPGEDDGPIDEAVCRCEKASAAAKAAPQGQAITCQVCEKKWPGQLAPATPSTTGPRKGGQGRLSD